MPACRPGSLAVASFCVFATKFNMRRQSTGHLWQTQPFSCLLDEDHLWAAIRYVERNPVRAKMVERAEDYPWSSAAFHCGLRDDDVLLDHNCLAGDRIQNWAEWLALHNDSAVDQRIRNRTYTGRPCGDDPFVRDAEQAVGRILTPRRPGPKPKASAAPDNILWTEDEIRF
jgi:putative transposase